MTRREFARYLVLGAGAIAAGNVGLAVWTQLRSINTGAPRPIVALDAVPVGEHVPVPLPGAAPTRRSCCASPTARWSRSARSAPTSAASSTTSPSEDRWHCPCHEGNFDALTGDVLSGPPTRPLGRIDVEIRDDGTIWALGRPE